MKSIGLFLAILIIAGGLTAQEVRPDKSSKKEASIRKKEEKEARIDKQYSDTWQLLNSKSFVLEAQYLRNIYGIPIPVSSLLNFIDVESNWAVIQIGSPQGLGYNGLGGVTARGRITKWKLNKNDKRKLFDLYMTVSFADAVYDVNMTIDYSGHASASLTGLNPGKLTFEGDLIPRDESSVFTGQTY